MKYKPTPRDLFNPPPQARTKALSQDLHDRLYDELWEIFPDCTDPVYRLWSQVLDITEELSKRTGSFASTLS